MRIYVTTSIIELYVCVEITKQIFVHVVFTYLENVGAGGVAHPDLAQRHRISRLISWIFPLKTT
jgi:hypothetical protein